MLDTVQRAYYFGTFQVVDSGTQEKRTEVAAFRHIKDKQSGQYNWFIYNPRYRTPIDVNGVPKKYRAWCRKVVDADIYLLERDKKAMVTMTGRKGKAKKPDQMVNRWLGIMHESSVVTLESTADGTSVVASPKYQ